MAKQLKKCTLEELYDREKITPKVREYIQELSSFDKIDKQYCEKVCAMPASSKDLSVVNLALRPSAEVLVVARHPPPPEKWKDAKRLERTFKGILKFIFEKKLGFPRWEYTYLAKCYPSEKQTLTKCKSCFPYLREQIRTLKPKVIVSTHTEVTKALGFKKRSNTNNRGVVDFYVDGDLRIPVIFTMHPEACTMIRQNASGAMWGPDYMGVLHRDLLKAACIATGQIKLKSFDNAIADIRKNKQVYVAKTLDDVKAACSKIMSLGPRKIISWDTETTGLDPWHPNARLLTTQFGYRREDGLVQAIVIPLWHKDNHGYNPDEAWPYVEEILLSNMIKIAHNAKFDLLYTIVTTGVRPVNVNFDTMLLLHAMNSGISGNYGLKAAVWDYLLESGLGGYEDQLDIDHVVKEELEE